MIKTFVREPAVFLLPLRKGNKKIPSRASNGALSPEISSGEMLVDLTIFVFQLSGLLSAGNILERSF